MGFGSLGVCDGEKYPDGSYWHQWMRTNIGGPKFRRLRLRQRPQYFPAPPPPGGCDGQYRPHRLLRPQPNRGWVASAHVVATMLALGEGTTCLLRWDSSPF